MINKRSTLVVFAFLIMFLGVQSALAGTGFWDLFSVDINPINLYWNQVNGGFGPIPDPLILPIPAGVPVTAPPGASALGGVAYGYGGATWFAALQPPGLEFDVSPPPPPPGYTLVTPVGPVAPSFLSVVLDTRTLPQADNLFPSWGTISNITLVGNITGPIPFAAIPWVLSPFDPNPAGAVVNVPGSSIT